LATTQAAKKTASARKVTRPAEQRHDRTGFLPRLITFIGNKQMIESLTLVNHGDKKKGLSGLRDYILDHVIKVGETDPETGSKFLTLTEPVEVGGTKYRRVKAQRSAPVSLNIDKATKWLERKGLLAQCTRRVVTLKLTEKQGDLFDKWYKETLLADVDTGTETPLMADSSALDEDSLLALVVRKQATENQIDSLYEENESFSLYVLQN